MTNEDIINHASFQIGLKVLICKYGKFLMLRHHPTGRFDLPGGRMGTEEKTRNLMEILKREITEELGGVEIEIGKPLFQFRRHFPDRGYDVFITVYEAEHISGEIVISEDHQKFEWMDPVNFDFTLEDFWHQEEYEAFRKYFSINTSNVG
ncbi:NUDIX hydrolase [Candidatus Peregrinibacteria bacterium]|nr:NUDIX hydrolase [Candidatus Peregrinibacteria bacterium]